jgi:hypothetical protein
VIAIEQRRSRHGKHRAHAPSGVVEMPLRLTTRCCRCRKNFYMEGQPAWHALRSLTEGLTAICDSCAMREMSRAS